VRVLRVLGDITSRTLMEQFVNDISKRIDKIFGVFDLITQFLWGGNNALLLLSIYPYWGGDSNQDPYQFNGFQNCKLL